MLYLCESASTNLNTDDPLEMDQALTTVTAQLVTETTELETL